MDENEYETLPSSNFLVNMTAGALAGVLEFGLTYPLDSVRTRMQSLSRAKKPSSIYSTLTDMIKTDGILRPMRGVSVVIAGTIPAHALYFGCYELSKQFLTTFTTMKNVNYITSAVVATIAHDAVANPTEVIKQRLQMFDSPYRSVVQCAKGVYKTEGLRAFYRSFGTQVLMNVPFQAVHFVTYECFQNLMNQERRYSPLVHVVAGGAAGGAAAAVTTPLDVVKTLLNTQELGFTCGMVEAAKQIYEVAGILGFFRGISARVVYTMPGTAICWTVYEFFKFYFCGFNQQEYKSSVSGGNLTQSKGTGR